MRNVSYNVVASLSPSTGDNQPDPVGITVRKLSEEKKLVVQIKGVSKINIGTPYIFGAMVKKCGQQKNLAVSYRMTKITFN